MLSQLLNTVIIGNLVWQTTNKAVKTDVQILAFLWLLLKHVRCLHRETIATCKCLRWKYFWDMEEVTNTFRALNVRFRDALKLALAVQNK